MPAAHQVRLGLGSRLAFGSYPDVDRWIAKKRDQKQQARPHTAKHQVAAEKRGNISGGRGRACPESYAYVTLSLTDMRCFRQPASCSLDINLPKVLFGVGVRCHLIYMSKWRDCDWTRNAFGFISFSRSGGCLWWLVAGLGWVGVGSSNHFSSLVFSHQLVSRDSVFLPPSEQVSRSKKKETKSERASERARRFMHRK